MLIILRYLLVSTVILTVTITKTAIAQASCTFTQLTPGSLVGSGGVLPTKLSSSGGNAAEVSVTCDESSSLSISALNQTAGPIFPLVDPLATVQTSTLSISSAQPGSTLLLSTEPTTLTINISVDKDGPIAAGNYTFSVVLTIVP